MRKANELSEVKRINEDMAFEKLIEISDILKYKFFIGNIPTITKNEYFILIEDEGEERWFQHSYTQRELLASNVNSEAIRLKIDLRKGIELDDFDEM